jgi:cysteine synthase A
MWGALGLIGRMKAAGQAGSVVTILSDDGNRYRRRTATTSWVSAQGMDLALYTDQLDGFLATGDWRGDTGLVVR